MDLRDVVLELVDELRLKTTDAAAAVYKAAPVREALNKLIEMIIDAAMEISHRYAHSGTGELLNIPY